MAPPVVKSTNGILQVPAAILQKQSNQNNHTPRAPPVKKPAPPKLKVVLRRLPPGLSQAEFEEILGEEWRVGAGKVDWFTYKAGKISTDCYISMYKFSHLNSAAKPSRPARAYLHLTEQAHLQVLSEKVLSSTFEDAKKTSKDPAVFGAPSLEFAPYTRVPNTKKKPDRYQGTIDQDPEFIEFLQSLTNPIQKPATLDSENGATKQPVKTTPLIEHIREQKAAAKKPTAKASAKHGKQELKDVKGSDKDKKVVVKGAKEVATSPEKGKRLTKVDKAAKEAVKVLTREASGVAQNAERTASASSTAVPERRRERAPNPISVAAKIQRDLGLAPAGGRRAKREPIPAGPASQTGDETFSSGSTPLAPKKDTRPPKHRRLSKSAVSTTDSNADAAKKAPSAPIQPTILKKPLTQAQPPKGPAAASRAPPVAPKNNTIPTGPASTVSEASTPSPITPTTPAVIGRQAFLKHANPSQGITETLIEEALKVFGGIEKVEIDRKKGFAYVDFADSETLRKAIAGSPIKIAQGAVQVLERRERGRAPPSIMPIQRGGFRGGRGGRGRGGRGGGVMSPGVAAAPTPSPATAAAPSGPVT
ncbi:hypothetical protein EJ08DRAFT_322896 [Tothia fuscella]|uniref:RRM domain-containing protein n=1 Tax=Tothia fuscella TaxID=1048955 RepID=A0A9P4NNW6_9PEZI|nr:hypothetical protein EJ08DRAFT_322896 [Tothia fuscella]